MEDTTIHTDVKRWLDEANDAQYLLDDFTEMFHMRGIVETALTELIQDRLSRIQSIKTGPNGEAVRT